MSSKMFYVHVWAGWSDVPCDTSVFMPVGRWPCLCTCVPLWLICDMPLGVSAMYCVRAVCLCCVLTLCYLLWVNCMCLLVPHVCVTIRLCYLPFLSYLWFGCPFGMMGFHSCLCLYVCVFGLCLCCVAGWDDAIVWVCVWWTTFMLFLNAVLFF